MERGDVFYSNVDGGMEVGVIDKIYIKNDSDSREAILICVGNGILSKFLEVTEYHQNEVVVEEPKFIGFICEVKTLMEHGI